MKPSENMSAYLDNNATTQPLTEVATEMARYLDVCYANPSSPHHLGRECRRAVEESRASVSQLITAKAPSEIVFTSCATESISHVFYIASEVLGRQGFRIVVSSVEHTAVLETAEHYESKGATVSILDVDAQGLLDLDKLESALSKGSAFVSLMWANNETGVIFPIQHVGEMCRRHNSFLHIDAVQAIGKLPVNVREVQCDYLSLSAHKFHGPKGVGALYIRQGSPRMAWMKGHQEEETRGGTENVVGIVGMGAAAKAVISDLQTDTIRMTELRDMLEQGILAASPGSEINGDTGKRLCNTSNIHFPHKNSANLVERLSMKGICVSAGAACTTGGQPSHVLRAMDLGEERANSSLRLSIGKLTTKAEIEEAIQVIPDVVRSSLDVRAVT